MRPPVADAATVGQAFRQRHRPNPTAPLAGVRLPLVAQLGVGLAIAAILAVLAGLLWGPTRERLGRLLGRLPLRPRIRTLVGLGSLLLFGGLGFFVELLIFGRFFYFCFGFAGVLANAFEISGVALDEFTLHVSPRTLVESFIVQSPARRGDQQQRTDENDRAGRSADDRIALRLCFLLYERFNRFRRFCHVR